MFHVHIHTGCLDRTGSCSNTNAVGQRKSLQFHTPAVFTILSSGQAWRNQGGSQSHVGTHRMEGGKQGQKWLFASGIWALQAAEKHCLAVEMRRQEEIRLSGHGTTTAPQTRVP